MDIKIEETEDTLKIIKSCKEELRWAFIIGLICNICIVYPLLRETPGEFYFGFLLFYTPIFLMIQAIFCHRFRYELIFIKEERVYLLQSFIKPGIINAEKFLIKNVVEIFAKKFNGSVLLMSHNIFGRIKTIKNHPNYKIHFYFKNETEEYYGWGYEIPMEEAEEVEKKVKEFLKKHNDIDLSS